MGQPAIPPLLMMKLEFLRYFCRLSDGEVIARSQMDVLFRWFLQIPVHCKLPDAGLLMKFRGRLGVEGFKKLFDPLERVRRATNVQLQIFPDVVAEQLGGVVANAGGGMLAQDTTSGHCVVSIDSESQFGIA